jgi:AbrB family looped-hinge helix DNA binding protein
VLGKGRDVRSCHFAILPTKAGFSEFRNYQLLSMSTTLVRVQHKGQVTIPSRLRKQAGIAEGDMVEATFQRGHIVLTPKVVIDRSAFPNADGEYTPMQRRAINRRLAKADKEIKSGRTLGPFDNADDMIASIERELKKRAAAKKIYK